jgi:hypothetical protein
MKNKPIKTVEPLTREDIIVLHNHVCTLFPGVDPQHIQKKLSRKIDIQSVGQETLPDYTSSMCFKFANAMTKSDKSNE